MKGFTREHTEFSLCGLACLLCPMQVGGYCPGCGGGAGNQSCAIARCSLEQGGLAFCSDCALYPCPRYDGFDTSDSFVPHRRRAADLDLSKEIMNRNEKRAGFRKWQQIYESSVSPPMLQLIDKVSRSFGHTSGKVAEIRATIEAETNGLTSSCDQYSPPR